MGTWERVVENLLTVAVVGAMIPLPDEVITYPLAITAGIMGISIRDIVKDVK